MPAGGGDTSSTAHGRARPGPLSGGCAAADTQRRAESRHEPRMTIPNAHIPWTRAGAFACANFLRCCQRFPRPFGGIRYARLTAQAHAHKKGIKRTTIERRVELCLRSWDSPLLCRPRTRAGSAHCDDSGEVCHYLALFIRFGRLVIQSSSKLPQNARKNGIFYFGCAQKRDIMI